MSILVLILLLAFGGVPIVCLAYQPTIATFFLASPPMLLAAWAIFLGLGIIGNATTSVLWLPFWVLNLVLFIIGVYIVFTRIDITQFVWLFLPAFLSLLLLLPYVIFGFADFPGSWLWDGWTYVDGATSLWSIPLGAAASADASPITWFGHTTIAASRFFASALISVISGVFPPGEDEQSATGFVLFSGVFAYISACGFLGVQIFAKSKPRILFMVLSGFSGAALNLVFANNFDHLLALSFGPLLTGIAISFKWSRPAEAAIFGASLGALEYVYPELSPVLALPAGVTMAWRALSERPPLSQALLSLGICFGTLLIVIGPNLVHTYQFFARQVDASVFRINGNRPGDYYYSIELLCLPGLFVGLQRPFSHCLVNILEYFKEIVALLILMMAATGAVAIARGPSAIRSGPPILLSVGFVAALALWAGVFLHYSYAVAKVSSSGWYMIAALIVIGLETAARAWVTPALFGAYFIAIFSNVTDLASFAFTRSIAPFRIVTQAPIGKDKRTAIQVNDPYSWEWANYFLRERSPLNLGYNHPYFIGRVASLPKFQMPLDVDFLISDTDYDNCFGPPIWTGGPYRAYRIQAPIAAILTGEDTPVDGRNLRAPVLSLFSKAEIVMTISAVTKSNVSISGELVAYDGKPAAAKLLLRSQTDQNAVDVIGHFATTLGVPAGVSKVGLALLPAANGASAHGALTIRGLAACADKD